MKLYLKKHKSKRWAKVRKVSEYDIVQWIVAFCHDNNVKTCDFKIEGEADMKCEVAGLPALFS